MSIKNIVHYQFANILFKEGLLYPTRAIISRGLYIFYPIFKDHFIVFKEVFSENWGPPHVLWEVSFGFWVTWSISSWQENYKSVFFPKLQFLNDKLQLYPKKLFGNMAKLFWSFYYSKVCKLETWSYFKNLWLYPNGLAE